MLNEIAERFKSRIVVGKNGCHFFDTGRIRRHDFYVYISLTGKRERAHRLAYRLFVGAIPTGLEVCHKCDVKGCCNPDHLFLGTHQENMMDRSIKGKHPEKNKKTCKNGHPLTDENLSKYGLLKLRTRVCLVCVRARSVAFRLRAKKK